jgi:hypothetical protein
LVAALSSGHYYLGATEKVKFSRDAMTLLVSTFLDLESLQTEDDPQSRFFSYALKSPHKPVEEPSTPERTSPLSSDVDVDTTDEIETFIETHPDPKVKKGKVTPSKGKTITTSLSPIEDQEYEFLQPPTKKRKIQKNIPKKPPPKEKKGGPVGKKK